MNYKIICFCSALLSISCNNNTDTKITLTDSVSPNNKYINAKAQILLQMAAIDDKLKNTTTGFNELEAQNALNFFNNFITNFPNDSQTSKYTFKCGELSLSMRHAANAKNFFERFIKNFPDHKRLPDAKFMLAFTYDDLINDDNKAKELYNAFLKEYPDHTLSLQAKQLLLIAGKSDAEIIKGFKK